MSKAFLFVVLFLLLFASVSVADKKVHDDWHGYRDTFTKDGVLYKIALNLNNYNSLRFDADDFSSLIHLESCVENGPFTYCYNNYSFDLGKGADIVGPDLVPGVHILIFEDEHKDEAVVREKISVPGSSRINEEHEYAVELHNEGNVWANPLRFDVVLPEGLRVTSRGQFDEAVNGLRVVTSMHSDQKRNYLFRFQPIAYGDHVIQYTLYYEFDGETRTKSGSHTVRVAEPYRVSVSLSPKSIEVFGRADLNVRIDNLESSADLVVKRLEVRGPAQADYTALRNLRASWPGVFVSTVNSISTSSDFRFRVSPRITGDHKVEGVIVLESHGQEFQKEFSESFKASASGLVINAYFDKTTVRAGSNLRFIYDLNNNNPNLFFNNFDVRIVSDLFNETLSLDELRPMQLEQLLRKDLVAPVVEEDKVYPVSITTNYMTDAGERLSFTENKEIRVTGAGSLLSLQRSVNPSSVEPGDEILVEVRVINPTDDYLHSISVYDEFPEGLERVSGPVDFRGSLGGREEKNAYFYKLRVPEDYRYESIKITTFASIDGLGFSMEESTGLSVTNIEDPLPVEEDEDDVVEPPVTGGTPSEPPQEPARQEHFFVRLVNGIGNFFSSLFTRG